MKGLIDMDEMNAKIRTLASLQLYIMEQDGEARRALERAMLNASITQSREIFFCQLAVFGIGLCTAFSVLNGIWLALALLFLFAFMTHSAIAAIKTTRALSSSFTNITKARQNCESAKTDIGAMAMH